MSDTLKWRGIHIAERNEAEIEKAKDQLRRTLASEGHTVDNFSVVTAYSAIDHTTVHRVDAAYRVS